MKFREYLKENYHKTVKHGTDEYWIFKNPDKSEVKDILNQSEERGEQDKEFTTRVRALITNKGDLYVWGVTLLHNIAIQKLGIDPADSFVQIVGYLDTSPAQLEIEIVGTSYEGEIDDNIEILQDTPFLKHLEIAFPNFTMSPYKSTNNDNIKLIGKSHEIVPKRKR